MAIKFHLAGEISTYEECLNLLLKVLALLKREGATLDEVSLNLLPARKGHTGRSLDRLPEAMKAFFKFFEGKTQKEIGDFLDISQASVSDYMTGKKMISPARIQFFIQRLEAMSPPPTELITQLKLLARSSNAGDRKS